MPGIELINRAAFHKNNIAIISDKKSYSYSSLVKSSNAIAYHLLNRKEDLNFDLGETANMIRETVKSFSDNEIAPRATEIDKKNDFPSDLWEKMGKLGILGVTVEEKWGGSGVGYLEHILVFHP